MRLGPTPGRSPPPFPSPDRGLIRPARPARPGGGFPAPFLLYDCRLMCGIVGYVGPDEALPIILEGLHRLEYRGYDSAGVAVLDGDLTVVKKAGKLEALEKELADEGAPEGTVGMGHTRWA